MRIWGLFWSLLTFFFLIIGSKGYKFDQNGSLITFQHDLSSSWTEDVLVFGIETFDKSTVLFRAVNKTLKRDIIVEIVNIYF
jgi:hypothetical protein